MSELVGYKLIDIKTGGTIQQWGGDWGQCPGIPNPILLPNGDYVSGAEPGQTYGERYRLDLWMMDEPAPTTDDVNVERDRRISSGFIFNGTEFQSRPEDRENVAGATTWAALAIMGGAKPGDYLWHGGKEDFAWIATDNSLVKMDAQTVIEFGKALGAWKSAHIFAARALKDGKEIPADYRDDKYWPASQPAE